MSVRYEWVVELVNIDSEDIIDTSAFESAAQARHYMARTERQERDRFDWGLCRDSYYPNDSRSWAYVEDGKLPENFEDAGGARVAKVPKRYIAELECALAQKEV